MIFQLRLRYGYGPLTLRFRYVYVTVSVTVRVSLNFGRSTVCRQKVTEITEIIRIRISILKLDHSIEKKILLPYQNYFLCCSFKKHIYVFPPMILCFGMIGNMVGLVVVSQKKMKKIGPRLTYLFLFLTDTIFLPLIIINHLGFAYGLDLLVVNSISCKINTYINFVLGAVSPWLLVYISVEKFISIQYPGKSFSCEAERFL